METITTFLRQIDFADLQGHCFERTYEMVFSNLANYAYETSELPKDGDVIPESYHVIAGKQLPDGSFLAFDPVFRSYLQNDSELDTTPHVQTIIFSAKNETELITMINTFYGIEFRKTEIEDTPYNRHLASRDNFADR